MNAVPSYRASVVIPVKNGGALFRQVLGRVMAQETAWPYECLVIDSGSTDGSLEYARSVPGVRVHQIAPSEFGHGRTRNLGASLTTGDFIALITHDALPGDDKWLGHLVAAAEQAEDVAGVFGRHVAYPGARIATRIELETHFGGFGDAVARVRLEDPARFRADPGYRQFLHFFSNNNSCIRRSVWERIPFPDVDFAEDQSWALQVVEAGYAKGYTPLAWVYHSHDFGLVETARRGFDEARALNGLFGYELVPSWPRLMRDWLYLTGRDMRWIQRASDPWSRKLPQLLQTPALCLARLLGRHLGTRHRSLSERLTHLISRDKALSRH